MSAGGAGNRISSGRSSSGPTGAKLMNSSAPTAITRQRPPRARPPGLAEEAEEREQQEEVDWLDENPADF